MNCNNKRHLLTLTLNKQVLMQYAAPTAGVLKHLGMGFQRAGQAYRGPETHVSSSFSAKHAL